jgi:hypothetical protein
MSATIATVPPGLELLLLDTEDVAEVADTWQNPLRQAQGPVGELVEPALSMEEELMQAWADVQMGVSYCKPGIDWEAVIDEMWGW